MRTANYIKNVKMGTIRQILTEILRFIVRTVFLYTLSVEYLGINGLFTGILAVLSMADLGFGTSIIYALYKPLAQNDIEHIKSLMALYKKGYRYIGIVIFLLGCAITPFLDYIINGDTGTLNIYFIFLLYLFNIVCSYLFFAYKISILNADQKKHIADKYIAYFQIVLCILQILLLIFLNESPDIAFYFYNISQITITILTNLYISKKVNKLYPYLKDKNNKPLDIAEKNAIFKNVKGLSIAKISGATMRSIDSIVISSAIVGGTALLGKYSNYLVVISSINAFVAIIMNSMQAGLGNYFATESIEKNKIIFKGIDLFALWAHTFCGICFFVLLNPFIGSIWLNDSFLLSDTAVFLISVNYILGGFLAGPLKYINAAGLYYQARYRYLISSVLNIALSIIFVVILDWGIEGVIFATVICTVSSNSLTPYIVFKHVFKESSRRYYIQSYISLLFSIITVLITKFVTNTLFQENDIKNFISKAFICLLVPNVLWFLVFRKSQGYSFINEKILTVIIRKGKGK